MNTDCTLTSINGHIAVDRFWTLVEALDVA